MDGRWGEGAPQISPYRAHNAALRAVLRPPPFPPAPMKHVSQNALALHAAINESHLHIMINRFCVKAPGYDRAPLVPNQHPSTKVVVARPGLVKKLNMCRPEEPPEKTITAADRSCPVSTFHC